MLGWPSGDVQVHIIISLKDTIPDFLLCAGHHSAVPTVVSNTSTVSIVINILTHFIHSYKEMATNVAYL